MFSPEHNVIFVHIPKTGGTSIEEVFCRRFKYGRRDNRTEQRLFGRFTSQERTELRLLGSRQHLTCEEMLKWKYVTARQFEACAKVSFVRNPWDKILSSFFASCQISGCREINEIRFEFKQWLLERVWQDFDSYTDLRNSWQHYRRQSEFLLVDGQIAVDFVGRFEHLERDLNEFCLRNELTRKFASVNGVAFHYDLSQIPHLRLPHRKRGRADSILLSEDNRREYWRIYDAETERFVGQHYAPDIEMFGYEFGN